MSISEIRTFINHAAFELEDAYLEGDIGRREALAANTNALLEAAKAFHAGDNNTSSSSQIAYLRDAHKKSEGAGRILQSEAGVSGNQLLQDAATNSAELTDRLGIAVGLSEAAHTPYEKIYAAVNVIIEHAGALAASQVQIGAQVNETAIALRNSAAASARQYTDQLGYDY